MPAKRRTVWARRFITLGRGVPQPVHRALVGVASVFLISSALLLAASAGPFADGVAIAAFTMLSAGVLSSMVAFFRSRLGRNRRGNSRSRHFD